MCSDNTNMIVLLKVQSVIVMVSLMSLHWTPGCKKGDGMVFIRFANTDEISLPVNPSLR